MNFISIIRELQIGKRTIFFSVLGQTYYFLIAFFLFKSELINRLDENFIFDIKFYYMIGISFLMSSIWFFINVGISSFVLMFHPSSIKYIDNPSGVFINSMISSIGYLSCAMLLNFILDYDFKHFLAYAFSFIAIKILWVIGKNLFTRRNYRLDNTI
ncbi:MULTISPECIES: hypothetical protein [Flavobacterium]|uniref:Uncharacterized protein n=1 Tax=Flavobacterium jumunjinense TaxID=998845 RepID=A0ABV5GNH2_9FLAO|nr:MULTISPECIES: hypothetical protein [Flavobacterium]